MLCFCFSVCYFDFACLLPHDTVSCQLAVNVHIFYSYAPHAQLLPVAES